MSYGPYIIGALYPPDPGVVPAYTQPGGPGTTVYPQQQQGEMMGLFTAICNHWFNSWRVQESSYVDDEGNAHTIALVQCPLCGVLQQVIEPYARIYSPEYMYIIG